MTKTMMKFAQMLFFSYSFFELRYSFSTHQLPPLFYCYRFAHHLESIFSVCLKVCVLAYFVSELSIYTLEKQKDAVARLHAQA